MSRDGIDRGDGVHLFESFILAATRDPGRIEAIFLEVAARGNIRGIEADGLLELRFHFFRIGKTSVAVRLAAIGPAEPLVIHRVFRIESRLPFRVASTALFQSRIS